MKAKVPDGLRFALIGSDDVGLYFMLGDSGARMGAFGMPSERPDKADAPLRLGQSGASDSRSPRLLSLSAPVSEAPQSGTGSLRAKGFDRRLMRARRAIRFRERGLIFQGVRNWISRRGVWLRVDCNPAPGGVKLAPRIQTGVKADHVHSKLVLHYAGTRNGLQICGSLSNSPKNGVRGLLDLVEMRVPPHPSQGS